MTIYFLGGGNMTAAIVTGLVKNRDFSVHVVNRGAEKREQLAKQFQVATSAVLPPLTRVGQRTCALALLFLVNETILLNRLILSFR